MYSMSIAPDPRIKDPRETASMELVEPVLRRSSVIHMRSPLCFNFDKATWLHHSQGYTFQYDPELAILWWVSIYIVHPCFAYGPRVCIDGQYHSLDDGEALSNYQSV